MRFPFTLTIDDACPLFGRQQEIDFMLHARAQQRELGLGLALCLRQLSRIGFGELRGLHGLAQCIPRLARGLGLISQRRRRGMNDRKHLILLLVAQG